MKIGTLGTALVTSLLFTGFALAQSKVTNPRNEPPGQMMRERGSVKGPPGASGDTPGHEMQKSGSVKGTSGASGYAPGHVPTGTIPKRR